MSPPETGKKATRIAGGRSEVLSGHLFMFRAGHEPFTHESFSPYIALPEKPSEPAPSRLRAL